MSFALDGLLYAVAWTHVTLAPYTKVEESFNLHATHDILLHGVSPSALLKYDHRVFSGPVPRSFVGSLFLAGLSYPIILIASSYEYISEKSDLQVIVRLVLATINATTLVLLRRSVARRFGRLAGVFFALLTCTQSHLPFWMGRTLPNMFALAPVNVATWLLMNREKNALRVPERNIRVALSLLTFTAVVLRAEVVLLLGPLALQALFCRWITFRSLVKTGIMSGISSIALTVAVDSYFWDKWLWPECSGIHYNVYQGKSSEWGVSPYHAYVTTHIPKLLLSALPLSLVGCAMSKTTRTIIFPSLLYVIAISALGHKEWRFIVYVVPYFNVAAARGARWMVGIRKGSAFGRLAFLFVMGALGLNVAATMAYTRASMLNYPGGSALVSFNELYLDVQDVHVHISNYAAQTGASLFLHINAPPYPLYLSSSNLRKKWTYDKTEHLKLLDLSGMDEITHVIAEEDRWKTDVWSLRATIEGFGGWDLKGFREWRTLRRKIAESGWESIIGGVGVHKKEMLWILERRPRDVTATPRLS
ncbi:alpha-1,6-mannosyltransferase subunit [Artomyces pyxidatus]|uniref:Alpha-1,6-mannosyltransferase subunit n=1 Tax=Artomyces pyxidatus TaxID=48021 RepID=A0ACB8TFR9_9AGAM|nr:alpha-1,6-mannosyltransferase subunit [Artomyces pyxidatus]